MLYLRLLHVFFKVSLLNELAYRANFWVQLFQTLISFATAIGGLAVIFSHTDNLGGWRPTELVMLLGVYFIMVGLMGMTIKPSLEQLMADVREGTLDYRLTKPASAQFLVSFREVRIWRVTDLLLGIGLLVAGAHAARRPRRTGAVAGLSRRADRRCCPSSTVCIWSWRR